MTKTANQPLNPIQVILGNIIDQPVDAIVNAANSSLTKGSGVCGAIHKAAGPELEQACREIGHCPTGQSVITKGYNLKAKYVIHAVGPIYWEHPEQAATLLASAYRSAFKLATEHGLDSIAFPCISTGIYGYPKREAAEIAIRVTKEQLNSRSIKVCLCCFEQADFEIYNSLLSK